MVLSLACTIVGSALEGFTMVLLLPLLRHLFGTAAALPATVTPLESFLQSWVSPFLVGSSPQGAIARVALMMAGVLFIKNVLMYAAAQVNTRMEEGLVATLRRTLYEHLLNLDLGVFQRTRAGVLVTSLMQEADQAKGVVTVAMVNLVRNISLLLTTIVILLTISWRLTLFILLVVPPLALVVRTLTRRIRKLAGHRAEERGQLAGLATERLAGIRLVRASDTAGMEGDTFGAAVDRYRKRIIRTSRWSALSGPVSEVVGAVLVLLVIYAGTQPGVIGLSTPLSPEVVLLFLFATLRINSPMKAIVAFPTGWAQSMASVERVFTLLDEPAVDRDQGGGREAAFTEALTFDHVGFSYEPGRPVLRDISFVVPPGRVVALVGPSGAGKSTLVDLVPRLREPTEGRILLDGVPLDALTRSSLRGLLGVVSQDTVLFHDTVLANIAYGRSGATRAEVERAAHAANAHEFVAQLPLGYETVLGERGSRLSGGQRQRIAIARALLRNAPILILDEATSSLDTQSERLVQEAIDRLMTNRTVLVIAHRLATVRQADEILVLDEGRIIQRGNHAELLQQGGLYRRLYEMQFRDEPVPPPATATAAVASAP